jgi:predicted transcriptional regulator
MADVLEINVLTSERTEREFTASELVHRDELQAAEQAALDEAAAKEAAKTSALAKLEALGLTADEAQAIAGF